MNFRNSKYKDSTQDNSNEYHQWNIKDFYSGENSGCTKSKYVYSMNIITKKVIDNISYVDGGMIMNLPIQALSGENIIAVSALETHYEDIQIQKRDFRDSYKILIF